MEFLEGDNLVDGIRGLGERAARRRGVSFAALVEETKASFDRDGYPAPYEGPGPIAMELYRRPDGARRAGRRGRRARARAAVHVVPRAPRHRHACA